jgi:N-acetylmuramoyl-L-alanine amidase
MSAGKRADRPGKKVLVWLFSAIVVLALAGTIALLLASQTLSVEDGASPQSSIPEDAPIPPLSGPPVIAIQAGHWNASELPAELAKLRSSTGASYGRLREVDINRAVSGSLAKMVEAEGWKALLLPSTVPPGLRADAFVAIHADWSDSPAKRGWKIAPPWRASPASRRLAESISGSFASEKGLVEDAQGVTIGMRGYYAFSYRRFVHTISPFTPAVVLELGFITNSEEGRSLATEPDYWAGLILRGLRTYLAAEDRGRDDDFRPAVFSWVAAKDDSVYGRQGPSASSYRLWALEPGKSLMPVDESGDWLELFLPSRRATAWVLKSELESAPTPYRPFNFPASGDR